MNQTQAKQLIDHLFACYPNAPTVGRRRREVVEAWAPHLEKVEYVDGLAGVDWLVKSNRFLPALAEVLEASRMTRRDRLAYVDAPDPLLNEPEPPGGYISLAEFKRQRAAEGGS